MCTTATREAVDTGQEVTGPKYEERNESQLPASGSRWSALFLFLRGVVQEMEIGAIDLSRCPRHADLAGTAAREVSIKGFLGQLNGFRSGCRLRELRQEKASVSGKTAAAGGCWNGNGVTASLSDGLQLRSDIHLHRRTDGMQSNGIDLAQDLQTG